MDIVTKKDVFTNNNNNSDEVKGKVVRKGRLARMILHEGQDDVRIIDVKPAKENPEKTVFVFRDDEKFQEVFAKVLENNRKLHEDNVENKNEIEDLKKKIEELQKAIASKEN